MSKYEAPIILTEMLDGPSLWSDGETKTLNWSDGEARALKKMWGTDITARQIGVEIGRTRAAVIGRANRMGLSKPKIKKPKPIVVVELAPPSKAAGCQFPLGKYPYHSCGEKTTPGASTSVYCKEHYKRCYRQRLEGDKFKVEGKGRIYPRPLVGWGSHMTSVL